MKGSARAGTVIAAPVNAEERLLKVCASVADKKYLGFRFIKVLSGIANRQAGMTGAIASIKINFNLKAM